MRLFTPLDWIHAQGAGPVAELTLHTELYEDFRRGGGGWNTRYVNDYLRPRGKTDEQIRDILDRRRADMRKPIPTEPLPVILNALGRFELDGDGHHRSARHVFEGSERVSVDVRLVSPLWQMMVDHLNGIYPGRKHFLYQEIEHPYFGGWGLSRSPERLQLVMDAIEAEKVRPDQGNYLELGSCTGRFCREFARNGWRCFGADMASSVVAVAEYLNMVFGTRVTYWCTKPPRPEWDTLLAGGDGWGVITCLSVLHSYHTRGETAWVGEMLRSLLDRTRVLITDGDVPGREYMGGVAWPEEQYRAWLEDLAGYTHKVKAIGKTEGRMIYLCIRE